MGLSTGLPSRKNVSVRSVLSSHSLASTHATSMSTTRCVAGPWLGVTRILQPQYHGSCLSTENHFCAVTDAGLGAVLVTGPPLAHVVKAAAQRTITQIGDALRMGSSFRSEEHTSELQS